MGIALRCRAWTCTWSLDPWHSQDFLATLSGIQREEALEWLSQDWNRRQAWVTSEPVRTARVPWRSGPRTSPTSQPHGLVLRCLNSTRCQVVYRDLTFRTWPAAPLIWAPAVFTCTIRCTLSFGSPQNGERIQQQQL